MEHIFIINPVAGKGKSLIWEQRIRDHFRRNPASYGIEFTKAPVDATTIARKHAAEGPKRIYAVGGDGTLNEVLNGLVGTDSPLGVLPAGSGNDFFRNLDTKADDTLLARTITGGVSEVTLGQAGEDHFINVASAGIDAAVAWNADRFKGIRFLPGMAAYIAGIFYTVFNYRSFPGEIRIEGVHEPVTLQGGTLLLAVANGRTYGGGMQIAPQGDIRRDTFEVYHVDPMGPLKILTLFPKLIQGKHETIPEVHRYEGRVVHLSSSIPFLVNVDGEIRKHQAIRFSLIPRGLHLIQPD